MFQKIFITLVLFSFCNLLVEADGEVKKHPKDKRVYRKFTLENQLKVVLVSDPNVQISSASLDVAVGALADPENRAGMAHFTEHMLFLGTAKYPAVDAYGEYLKSRGGYSNAFTAGDHTNYHFQVNTEGLGEALDRFAQFFIAPSLNQEYLDKEMNAVHSEHQKNIPQDTWRLLQLHRSSLNAGHPANHFHTGNLETLQGVSQAEVKQFLADYYSADKMALCIVSSQSLDSLERQARELFSPLSRRTTKAFEVPEKVLDEKDSLRLFEVLPIQEMRLLQLHFPLPCLAGDIFSKSHRLIGMTLGDEGAGSLLSFLKKKNLATTLSASVREDSRFFSSCTVSIGLTEQGVAQHQEVLQLCFAYLEMLKKSPFPDYLWEELKTMTLLEELYSPKGEGTDIAIELASNANTHGLEWAENLESTFSRPDPERYFKILEALHPANMLVFLVAPGLKTELKEKWYQTDYRYSEDSGAFYQSLKAVPYPPELHLPPPNPFIPKNINFLKEEPVLLTQDRHMTIWYHQDQEFFYPKVSIYLKMLSPSAYHSPRHYALTELYTLLLQEQLNEFSYPAQMAGLAYSLSASPQGVLLSVQGYSDSALALLKTVSENLKNITVSSSTFEAIKTRYVQALKNSRLGQPYVIAREVSREINLRKYFKPEELVEVAQALSLQDVKQHLNTLYERNHLNGLFCGNISANQAQSTAEDLVKTLGFLPSSPLAKHQDEVLWLSTPGTHFFAEVLPSNNSCLRLEYQVGLSDYPTEAISSILDHTLRNAFYTEMRTQQQLGYIVFSSSYIRETIQNFVFIIQSGEYPAQELFKRADAFLLQVPQILKDLPEEQFEGIRQSLIEELQKKPKSIAEKAGQFYTLIFDEDANFLHYDKKISALRQVKREEVVQMAHEIFSPESQRRIAILMNADQHKETPLPPLQDLSEFHRKNAFDKKKK